MLLANALQSGSLEQTLRYGWVFSAEAVLCWHTHLQIHH